MIQQDNPLLRLQIYMTIQAAESQGIATVPQLYDQVYFCLRPTYEPIQLQRILMEEIARLDVPRSVWQDIASFERQEREYRP